MPDQWFVLPIATREDGSRYPKYTERDGISRFSGQTHHFDADTYPMLPFAGEEMYVGRIYGSSSALDALAAETDAYGQQEYGLSDSKIAQFLNHRFSEDRSLATWMNSFEVSE